MSDMELDCFIKDMIVYKNGILLMKNKHEASWIHFLDSNFVLGNAAAPPDYPIVYCSDGFCSLTGETGPLLPLYGTPRANVCHYVCHNIAILLFQECTEQKSCSNPPSAPGSGRNLRKTQT